MLCPDLSTFALAPLAAGLIPPMAILGMCVIAAIGTIFMLPTATLEPTFRRVGGAILLLALLLLGGLLARQAAFTLGLGVYFWIFSAIALFSAMMVVVSPKPVHSALYFVLTVFASAGLFVLLWAEFMAAALVLIYAGAILVTYLFVIMLAAGSVSDRAADTLADYDLSSREPVAAAIIGITLMGLLLLVIFDRAEGIPAGSPPQPISLGTPPNTYTPEGSTQRLGVELFRNHLVSLELAGLILTLAMVGAIVIARRQVLLTPERLAEERALNAAGPTIGESDPRTIPIYGTDNPRQKAYPET